MEWRDIAGYEGLYRINHLGEVMSLPRNTTSGRFLKPQFSKGYQSVGLSKNGVVKNALVHALVAKTFIGPYPQGKEVNHIDGNRANPRLWNLEYVTPSENVRHARHVLGVKAGINKGESAGSSKLKNEQVLEIRKLRSDGIKQVALARQLNVSRDTVRKITQRIYWKHI